MESENEPERELLNEEFGFKVSDTQKNKFEKHLLVYTRILKPKGVVSLDVSKILREMVREWNRMMDAGTPPDWLPKFYAMELPDEMTPRQLPPKRNRPKK